VLIIIIIIVFIKNMLSILYVLMDVSRSLYLCQLFSPSPKSVWGLGNIEVITRIYKPILYTVLFRLSKCVLFSNEGMQCQLFVFVSW